MLVNLWNRGMLMEQAGGEGGGGGASGGDAGAGDKGGGEGGEKGGKPELVSREDHERALADLHKFKKEAEKLKTEREAEKTAKLKEENRWKELAEQNEQEAKTAREEAARIKDSYVNGKKYSAVQEKCMALGLRPEAVSDLEMLDLADIPIETTSTGKINVLGADKFAERLKTLKPHWFAEKKAPSINADGTRVVESNDGQITVAQLLAEEAKGKKSGDLSGYYALHKKYLTQRAAGMRR